jgi:hypothetical protein
MDHRCVLIPAADGLPWLAVGVHALIAVVTFRLVASMDLRFAKAVAEGRVFPYTGEAGDQAFFPTVVLCLSALCTLVTLGAAASGRMIVVSRWRVAGTVVVSCSVVLAVVIDASVLYVATIIAGDEMSQQLFARWYVPFLVVGTLAHASILIAGTLASHRRRWR